LKNSKSQLIIASLFKYIKLFLFLIIIFLMLLFVTSLISSKYLTDNVRKSADIMKESISGDSNYGFIKLKNNTIVLDYYTDALMLNIIYSIDNNNPVESMLLARKNYIKNKTKIIYPEEVGELKSVSKYEYIYQLGELYDTINNDIEESFEYSRYWHGYIVILRPLLVLFDINTIKIIFGAVLYSLAGVLVYLIKKKIGLKMALIFLLEIIAMDYWIYSFQLQGVFVVFISMIAQIIILMCDIKKWHININYLFFIIGSVTCFLDVLTTPIMTIGLPLIIYCLLNEDKIKIKDIIKIIIVWGIGYVSTWALKWVIIDLLYNRNILQIAIEQALYRTGVNTNKTVSLFQVTYHNLKRVNIALLTTGLSILFIILNKLYVLKKENGLIFINVKNALPYAIIGCLPLIVYEVLKNHSYIHAFFTYRNLMISLICLIIIIDKTIIICNKKEKKLENK